MHVLASLEFVLLGGNVKESFGIWFETLEIAFPERIQIIRIDSSFFSPLLSDGFWGDL